MVMERRLRAPWWLLALSAAFLAGMAAILASSMVRPAAPPGFVPGEAVRWTEPGGTVRGRFTLDARHSTHWAYFSFARGKALVTPGPREWDLAARRFSLVVNGGPRFAGEGGARALGDIPLDTLRDLPDTDYEPTAGSLADSPRHPVLEDWYRYGFVSHLLRPRPITYGIRTADGRYAALRILSYYCAEAEPGCVTFEYLLPRPADTIQDLRGGSVRLQSK